MIQPGKKITTVFEEGASDWKAYVIAEYDQDTFEKVKELKLWTRMDNNKTFTMVSERVALFKNQTLSFKPEYKKLFTDYPIEFDKNSLFYIKQQNNGYFMAILNVNNQKMYTMEVTL